MLRTPLNLKGLASCFFDNGRDNMIQNASKKVSGFFEDHRKFLNSENLKVREARSFV